MSQPQHIFARFDRMKQGMMGRAQERAAAQAYVDQMNAAGVRARRPLAPAGLDGIPVDDLEDTLFDHDGHFLNPDTGEIEEVRLAAIPEPPLASGRGSSGMEVRDGMHQFWESRQRNWEHQPRREILAPPPELDPRQVPGQDQFEASKARQQLGLRLAAVTALTPEKKNVPSGVHDSVQQRTLNEHGFAPAASNWETRDGDDTRLQDKYGLPVSDSGWVGHMGEGSGTGFWHGRDRYAAELLERFGHGSAADVTGETVNRHPNAYGADLSDFVGLSVPARLAMIGAVTTINDGAGEQASSSAAASGTAQASDYADLGLGLDAQLARIGTHAGDLGYDQRSSGRAPVADALADYLGDAGTEPRSAAYSSLGYDQTPAGRAATADLSDYLGTAAGSEPRSAVYAGDLGYDQQAPGRAGYANISGHVGDAGGELHSAVYAGDLGRDQLADPRAGYTNLETHAAGGELRSGVYAGDLGRDQKAPGRAGYANIGTHITDAGGELRSAVYAGDQGYDQLADPRAGYANIGTHISDAGAELRSGVYAGDQGYDQKAPGRAGIANIGTHVSDAGAELRSGVYAGDLGRDQLADPRGATADALSAYLGDAASGSRSGFGVRPFNPLREVPGASGAGRTAIDHNQATLDWGWAPAIPPRPESDKHPFIGQNPRTVMPDLVDGSQLRAAGISGRPDNYAQEYAGRFDNPDIPSEFGSGLGLVPSGEAPRQQSVRDQIGANPRTLVDTDVNLDRANWPDQSAIDQAARVESAGDEATANGWFQQKQDWNADAAARFDRGRLVAEARPTMVELAPEQHDAQGLWSRTHAPGNAFDAYIGESYGIRGRAATEIDGLSDISGYNTDDTGFASDGSSVQ